MIKADSVVPSSDETRPIRELMAAMLERAIQDANGSKVGSDDYVCKRISGKTWKHSWRDDAWEWINSNDDEPYSLLWCLDWLGISRAHFIRMIEVDAQKQLLKNNSSELKRSLRSASAVDSN